MFPEFRSSLTIPEQEIHAVLALHEKEVLAAMQDGVEQAVNSLGPEITKHAYDTVRAKIMSSVTSFFTWGEGSVIIDNAVKQGLKEYFSKESNET